MTHSTPSLSLSLTLTGLTAQQKESLRMLRVELAEEGKKAKSKAKSDAKEARIKVRNPPCLCKAVDLLGL